ncbi:translocon subunit SSS1 [Aspergillus chevalieri]|uniref:Sec61p translocation complex subunit n=1 Tax=Aspergillus chevalieri TaxID=182096 RepID=A0A7R7VVH7_ASPCH|nr:Sec61p translocation complex subunit [Aspergillus chevalieri]BCR91545.1 Sec61p translocation complex subunit [Aspergillus chevalieri]
MSDNFQELADIPKDFVRDGSLFIKRCTKPDQREFIKISQAVGMGFLIMVWKIAPSALRLDQKAC